MNIQPRGWCEGKVCEIMILCFGDSLTQGIPGVTYLKYLKNKKAYKNFGLGGDTVTGMTRRLRHALMDDRYKDADAFIVGIGTNDILLPFLKTYSPSWANAVAQLMKRGSMPCKDKAQFTQRYAEMLEMLEGRRTVVFGLPFIETQSNDLNDKAAAYDEVIEAQCAAYHIPFINFGQWQREWKHRQNNTGSYFFTRNRRDVVTDALLTTILPFTDYISKKRGLAVTVDGAHLNTVSAKGLARLVEDALAGESVHPRI